MDLNQVTLGVTDVSEAIRFYQTLGLTLIVHTHDAYARFECPGGATLSVHLVHAVRPSTTLVYFECDDLDARIARLQEAGVAITQEPTDQSWLWREARLSDPFGNPLCLYHAGEARRFPPWRHAGAPLPHGATP